MGRVNKFYFQSQKAVVTAVRAEYHLSQGRVELAAKYMAQCPDAVMPFADTSIRLALPMLGGRDNNDQSSFPRGGGGKASSLKANEALASSNMALITFLNDKMKGAKSQNDSMVCTMLGTWLTELHLQEREMDVGLSTSGKQSTSLLRRHPKRHKRPTAGKSRPASPISVLVCSGYGSQRDRERVGLT